MTDSALREFLLHRRSSLGSWDSVDAGRRLGYAARLRAGLIAGCAMAIGSAWYLGNPGGLLHADPSMARLLRGMALIKGVIAIAAVAAVSWRFGRPVSKPVAAAYLVGSWILMGSTSLIWQLSWIPVAAILFHGAAVSLLVVSARER